jgi:hypothetical protein
VGSSWRVAPVFLCAISLFGLAAGSAGAQPAHRAQPIKPHGTLPEKLALLTTQQLAEVPEAPTGIKAVPTGHGVTLFSPSGGQQGPCGLGIKIHVARKTIASGAGREFESDSLSGYQYVIDLPGTEATEFLTAWQKQLHPGCPAYTSTNPNGQVETTKLLSVLAIPSDVNQAAGSLEEVETGESSVGVYTFAFRMGRRLEMLALFVPQPLSQTFGDGLVSLAESRLRASEGAVA